MPPTWKDPLLRSFEATLSKREWGDLLLQLRRSQFSDVAPVLMPALDGGRFLTSPFVPLLLWMAHSWYVTRGLFYMTYD